MRCGSRTILPGTFDASLQCRNYASMNKVLLRVVHVGSGMSSPVLSETVLCSGKGELLHCFLKRFDKSKVIEKQRHKKTLLLNTPLQRPFGFSWAFMIVSSEVIEDNMHNFMTVFCNTWLGLYCLGVCSVWLVSALPSCCVIRPMRPLASEKLQKLLCWCTDFGCTIPFATDSIISFKRKAKDRLM